MGSLRPAHIIVLVVVLVLLFGAKRLPDAARALGRSLRIIKAETKGLVDDKPKDDLAEKADAQAAREPLTPQPQPYTEPRPQPEPRPTFVDPVDRVRDRH